MKQPMSWHKRGLENHAYNLAEQEADYARLTERMQRSRAEYASSLAQYREAERRGP